MQPASICRTDRGTIRAAIRSARRLAATGEADLFLQAVEADGADYDLLADHVAGRAVHAHRLGELEILLDVSFHFRACQILFDPGGIEPGFLATTHRACLFRGPAAAGPFLFEIN